MNLLFLNQSFSSRYYQLDGIQLFHHVMKKRENREAESQWYAGCFDPRPQAENMRILILMDLKKLRERCVAKRLFISS